MAVGHISLTVSDVNQATRFFETVGMRLIHLGQTTSVLELRGGTHLVVKPTEGPIAPGSKAPFDLMVDDIGAAHDDYAVKGWNHRLWNRAGFTSGLPCMVPTATRSPSSPPTLRTSPSRCWGVCEGAAHAR